MKMCRQLKIAVLSTCTALIACVVIPKPQPPAAGSIVCRDRKTYVPYQKICDSNIDCPLPLGGDEIGANCGCRAGRAGAYCADVGFDFIPDSVLALIGAAINQNECLRECRLMPGCKAAVTNVGIITGLKSPNNVTCMLMSNNTVPTVPPFIPCSMPIPADKIPFFRCN